MSEQPFIPPGSPEFSAPIAPTKKFKGYQNDASDEYVHPMEPKFIDVKKKDQRNIELANRLRAGQLSRRKKFGSPVKDNAGEKGGTEIIKEENGNNKAA